MPPRTVRTEIGLAAPRSRSHPQPKWKGTRSAIDSRYPTDISGNTISRAYANSAILSPHYVLFQLLEFSLRQVRPLRLSLPPPFAPYVLTRDSSITALPPVTDCLSSLYFQVDRSLRNEGFLNAAAWQVFVSQAQQAAFAAAGGRVSTGCRWEARRLSVILHTQSPSHLKKHLEEIYFPWVQCVSYLPISSVRRCL